MARSYLPSFRKTLPNKETIELYKELFNYYKLKKTELGKSRTHSTEDQALLAILKQLDQIKYVLAPLEYFEVLNFINDMQNSGSLQTNKTLINTKIENLKTTVEPLTKLKSETLSIKMDEINQKKPALSQEDLASKIREQQGLLNTAYLNERDRFSFEMLSFQEIETEETTLQALLFLYYSGVNISNTTQITLELQQRNLLLTELNKLQHKPGLQLVLVDYCTILNKIDQAMDSKKFLYKNDKLVGQILEDITKLSNKIDALEQSVEGNLTLFMSGQVK